MSWREKSHLQNFHIKTPGRKRRCCKGIVHSKSPPSNIIVAVACVRAQSATIFPVALGPEANLQGEIIGSGGEVGTTFVLSGQTLGVEFTC